MPSSSRKASPPEFSGALLQAQRILFRASMRIPPAPFILIPWQLGLELPVSLHQLGFSPITCCGRNMDPIPPAISCFGSSSATILSIFSPKHTPKLQHKMVMAFQPLRINSP
ncbi:unnamed protein product [Linum trigynum]|uniref:Uncharacterized protein n=1 Tax=Linum trigynum TaxID=586398 RepID=A0AAV2GNT0_9ROSI